MSAHNLELVLAPDESGVAEGWTRALFTDALADLKALRNVFRWRRVRLVTENPAAVRMPVKTGIALLLLAPRDAEIVSVTGEQSQRITLAALAGMALRGLRGRTDHLKAMRDLFAWLEESPVRAPPFAPTAGPPLYLHTNLWFGAKVGGSLSHTAGVIGGLHAAYGAVDCIATETVPAVDPAIPFARIDLNAIDGWQCGEGLYFAANAGLLREALRLAPPAAPALVYQRGRLADLSGMRLARHYRRPFVFEYNGSEIWVAKHWGDGLPFADAFERIETELLRRADLVVVVSRPLREEVIARGAAPERVLLSPNAVDPQRFRPDIDGAAMREKLALGARKTALLLSSFGPWHGVEIAVEAYAALLQRRPTMRGATALVLAGAGSRLPAARALARDRGLTDADVLFPGSIAATDAPALLAAADVLLAPTVPNPDGSPFFGSPTKLFEYMAMGKPIIASGIDQVAEVLTHEHTALLVPPGDVDALSAALERAFDDPAALAPLGAEARREAVAHHSWASRMSALREAVAQLGPA